ncbi:glycosyltransferase family 2 protein [Anaerorudis cellulosivorans]|jgi:glycosyltransferase involved in cell wall biosynthesis|uniref:glycosyltransferase family 2 protein n=1 Tax=Anaerorudis cellulosivorans TaxID=3397862 RepID=UPI00221F9D40|nr:glycosyltransferase family 2 protein [Seramator thermalis]MCW1734241.1 glycosyltransferase family 2 protein [Seramator thermalis]
MNPLNTNYSIIIPHKNIPTLLRRCLDSIPKRNDVQIIVVDDNSDPGMVDFSKFPGLNETNIEVYFTKEGKGAGYARNIGLSKAKGKWLIFADADDFFNDCFNEIMDKYQKVDADIIFFLSNSVECDTMHPIESRGKIYNEWLIESLKKGIILEEVRYCINPPWAKIFSNSFIKANQIQFDEIFTANDVMFSSKSGNLAKKIIIDTHFLYCSTVRNNSLDYEYSYDHVTSRLKVAINKYNFLMSIDKPQYRMNVIPFIIQLKRSCSNGKWIKVGLIPAFHNIRLAHLISDFIQLLKMKFTLNRN